MPTSHFDRAPLPRVRRLHPEALAKLKAEIVRIGTNGTQQGFEFAQKMFARYPELKNA